MMEPSFTIGIPVFNRLNFFKEALNSVLNQVFDDYEIVIVDDCSTDGTWEYIKAIKDSRVKVFRNPKNLGIVPNWRRCIEEANGIWFKFLMSDDLMFPDSLYILKKLINRYTDNFVFVTSGAGFREIKEISKYIEIRENIDEKKQVDPNLRQLNSISKQLKGSDKYMKSMDYIISQRKKFNQTWAMPNSYTLLTEDLKELIKTDKYKEVEDKLGQTGHCVDYFILYSVALKYKTMIEMDLPLYAVRYHESNLSKSYNQNLLYHLNGDKFIHYILYNYKGIENLYIIRHAFRIYFHKLFSNKRKIFSLNLFKWTFQLIVFIFQHLFNINKKFSD